MNSNKVSSAWKMIVAGEEAEKLNVIYQKAFEAASFRTPCLQSYGSEDFIHVLGDKEVVKMISYFDEEPVGMALVTGNLDKVPWINKNFYRHNFPEYFDKKMIFYVKSILVVPEMQDVLTGEEQTRIITKLIKMIEEYLPENSIFCFDNSYVLNNWFAKFLLQTTPSVHPLSSGWEDGLDKQFYYAFLKNFEKGYGKKIAKEA